MLPISSAAGTWTVADRRAVHGDVGGLRDRARGRRHRDVLEPIRPGRHPGADPGRRVRVHDRLDALAAPPRRPTDGPARPDPGPGSDRRPAAGQRHRRSSGASPCSRSSARLTGALVLAAAFVGDGRTPRQAAWWGVFHSISAFNNAGFDLVRRLPQPHGVRRRTRCVLGSIGAPDRARRPRLRDRRRRVAKRRWVRLALETKLVLLDDGRPARREP